MNTGKLVPYEGPEDAEFAFIGEAPGENEVTEGRPFVGLAGLKLMSILNMCGLAREDVRLMNVCRHNPEDNKFKLFWLNSKQTIPTDLLDYEIQELKNSLIKMPNLKVVFCLGRQAMHVLSGLDGITKQRGTILDVQINGHLDHIRLGALKELNKGTSKKIRTIFTFHPSYIRRIPALEYIMYLDIMKGIRNKDKERLLPEREMCIYPNVEDWLGFLKRTEGKKYLSVDVETRGKQITRLGMCVDQKYAISVPFQNINTGEVYHNDWVWPGFQELLNRMIVIGQNFINYDLPRLEAYGCHFPNPVFDTMTAEHIILPGLPKMLHPLSLQFLTSIFTNEPFYKDEGKEIEGKLLEDEAYGKYNCKDVFTPLEIAMKQMQHKDFKRRLKVFNFETRLARTTLHDLTERGVKIDVNYRNKARERAELECEYLTLKLSEKIGKNINIASPQQVAKLLYRDLRLTPIYKKNAKGQKVITTDENAVKTLRIKYKKYKLPELDSILQFREVEQLRKGILTTDIDKDNRIRCTFKQDTDSGRLSSESSPWWTGQSLHVIPHSTKIRKMFLPDEDVWVHRDFSQAEAWATYYYARADEMIKRMQDGIKPHQIMASIISGKSYSDSGKGTEQYELGKRVVHGADYMMGPITLVKTVFDKLNIIITVSQAKQYIAAYYRLVPEVPIWHLSILNELKNNNMTLTTALGRERKFYGRFDGTVKGSIKLLQSAVSFKPQSTIGDLQNLILLRWEDLKTVGTLLVPVHDEGNTTCKWGELDTHIWELDKAYDYTFDIDNYKNIIIPWDTELKENWGEAYDKEGLKRWDI